MPDIRALIKFVTFFHVRTYRATKGRLGGRIGGAKVLLLYTVGRRSGKRRINPLIYCEDGPNLVIAASNAGNDQNPGWWANLRTQPETQVMVKGEDRRVRARQAEGEERERLWKKLVDVYANYDRYQSKTSRRIPVVVLEPVDS